jgi:hypothetical protein
MDRQRYRNYLCFGCHRPIMTLLFNHVLSPFIGKKLESSTDYQTEGKDDIKSVNTLEPQMDPLIRFNKFIE